MNPHAPIGCAALLVLWLLYCAAIGATLHVLDWIGSLLP